MQKGVLVRYLLLFTVVGGLPLFFWLEAVGSNLTWVFALYFTRRFFLQPTFPLSVQGHANRTVRSTF